MKCPRCNVDPTMVTTGRCNCSKTDSELSTFPWDGAIIPGPVPDKKEIIIPKNTCVGCQFLVYYQEMDRWGCVLFNRISYKNDSVNGQKKPFACTGFPIVIKESE